MKVKYSKKIDKEVFDEVNKMKKKLSPVFGFNFPKLSFKEKVVPVAKAIAKSVGLEEKKLKKIMKAIYGKDMPDITVYINTTPFSTWNVDKKYISVSCFRFGKFFETVCHESNHFMYDVVFGTKKYQNNEIKETVTVLNNAFGIEDRGSWEKFSKTRKKVFDYYKRTKNFKKTLEYAKNIC